MRLSTLLMICVALQFSLILFSEGTYVDNTDLLSSIINPSLWNSTIVLSMVALITMGALLAGSWVGNLFMGRNDLTIFAGIITIFIAWLTPIVSLWTMIYKEGYFGTNAVTVAGISISGNTIMASLIVAPLFILALTTTLNWWRSPLAEG